jgi:hypothetical protein
MRTTADIAIRRSLDQPCFLSLCCHPPTLIVDKIGLTPLSLFHSCPAHPYGQTRGHNDPPLFNFALVIPQFLGAGQNGVPCVFQSQKYNLEY